MDREDVYADLHTHTDCSDGVLSPEALVDLAVEHDLGVLAVTDHDTVAGVVPAKRAARDRDLQLVAGVELSVTVNQEEVHLLAYGIEPENSVLQNHLEAMKKARKKRVHRIVDRLREIGLEVEDDVLLREVETNPSVGRPHVAEALVRSRHVDTIRQAFQEYLARDCPGFVAKPAFPASEALRLVHEADGVGVLAHPGHWTPSKRLRHLVEVGLDGIEITHPSHDSTLQQYYGRMAQTYDLCVTGGSDYHGRTEEDDCAFGTLGMTQDEWERFRERAL